MDSFVVKFKLSYFQISFVIAETQKCMRVDFFGILFLIAAGHLECIQLLIRHGADVNLPDVKAQPPLMMAVKNKHFECVRALLDAGANPNGDERSLCSPLYVAAMDGFTDALMASAMQLMFNI